MRDPHQPTAIETGRVASLHLHPSEPGAPLQTVDAIELEAHKGIVGDNRYFARLSRKTGQPTRRQVSIIEREQLSEHAAVLGLQTIPPGAARANIETSGLRLAELVGRQVAIGTAVLNFYEARIPCEKMDAVCQGLRELMENGRQGVMAEVVQSGRIRVGDAIQPLGEAEVNVVENAAGNGQIHTMQSVFTGPVYVVRDNIDTDQIIPAQYLNLVPTIKEEYEKLGAYALCGLPDSLYPTRFVKDGQLDSEYPIVVGGRNFGCGSSREHAPIAMGSANCKVVLAEGFARIFFRNCVATGELYPCEVKDRLCDILKTGDVVTVDLDAATVTVKATGKVYSFKPLGDVRPVVDAGGLFNYARKSGMIPAQG